MAKDYMDERIEFLFRGILTLKTPEECRAFFEDICTVKEISEMSRRLCAAKMLDENKVYTEIAEATGNHLNRTVAVLVDTILPYVQIETVTEPHKVVSITLPGKEGRNDG